MARRSSPSLAALLLGEFRRLSKAGGGRRAVGTRAGGPPVRGRGTPTSEIGAQLFIAEKTVENHVRNILGKLHLNRKQELIRYALEHGIE